MINIVIPDKTHEEIPLSSVSFNRIHIVVRKNHRANDDRTTYLISKDRNSNEFLGINLHKKNDFLTSKQTDLEMFLDGLSNEFDIYEMDDLNDLAELLQSLI